ncbi:MAG TPA: pyruvate dehydrogenase, partial [Chloroflexota bacterium]|nr:pyruvate dehydrogenase [Chloroflexota bacterium]
MSVALETLERVQQRVLWLATRMVHEANHIRPSADHTKVGGHQASSASVVSIVTALYFGGWLRAGDRVSIKPHASPVFHAVQYLLGNLDRRYLTTLRDFGGLQAYPSRTKDPDPVDFSTGSVGLGAAAPLFAALADRYAATHFRPDQGHPTRRFIALVGDAELDEGNVWEAISDETIRGTRLGNVLWIVDLNRQSLDRVIPGIKVQEMEALFRGIGWQVLEAKYGRRLQAAFDTPGGQALRRRIDDMPNEEYQDLVRTPGASARERLLEDAPAADRDALGTVLSPVTDENLPGLLGDLGGHDLAELLKAFRATDDSGGRPTVLFAYTMKGWGLPFAGDPLNHSALLSPEQIDALRARLCIPAEDDWACFTADSAE